jgi:hypothetical protein
MDILSESARAMGKKSALSRDTSSDAMRDLVKKRWGDLKIFKNKKGQKIGWSKEGIFRKEVSKKKHLMKIFDAWGIDWDVLSEIKDTCTEIRIRDKDEHKVYTATPEQYMTLGIKRNFDGEQVFLQRKHFSVKEI